MNDTWKFEYAYSFTSKEELNRRQEKLRRPFCGLSQQILDASYSTSLYDELGLSKPFDGIMNLPEADCRALVKYWYWDKPNLEVFPQKTGAMLFDMCVTHGVKTAFTLAQRGFNKCLGIYGAKLRVDGVLSYAMTTALGNETNRTLSNMLMERLRFLRDVMGEDRPRYRLWAFRCIRLKDYLGVPDEPKH